MYKSFNFLKFTISILYNAELRNRPRRPQEETLSVNSTVVSKQFTVSLSPLPSPVKSILRLLLLVPSSFKILAEKTKVRLKPFLYCRREIHSCQDRILQFRGLRKVGSISLPVFRGNYAHFPFPKEVKHFKMLLMTVSMKCAKY